MAAYLRFYQLERAPFEHKPTKGLVLGTQSLRAAFSEIKNGLDDDSPRICLSGSTGVGKTSLCRALPKLLKNDALVVPILNPQRPWEEIRASIAKKLELPGGNVSRRSLLSAHQGRDVRLVLLIDQAEELSHETLDHLDVLLQYKGEDGRQLLQCVLLANLDTAATGAEVPLLWWLDRFTTLQLQLAPIPADGIGHYISKHLAKAGWNHDNLFSPEACMSIHRHTDGLPRAINELCERALVEAGVRAISRIDADLIDELCGELPRGGHVRGDEPSEIDASMFESAAAPSPTPTAQEMLDQGPAFATPVDTRESRRELMHDPLPLTDAPIDHYDTPASKVEESSTVGIELADEPARFEDFTHTIVRAPSPTPTHLRKNAPRPRRSSGFGAAGRVVLLFALFVAALGTVQLTGEFDLIGPLLEQIARHNAEEVADPSDAGIDEFVQKMAARAAEDNPPRQTIPTLDAEDVANAWLQSTPISGSADREIAPEGGTADPSMDPMPIAESTATPDTGKVVGATQNPALDIPSELVVINEHTAIPEASLSPPAMPADSPQALESAGPAPTTETPTPAGVDTKVTRTLTSGTSPQSPTSVPAAPGESAPLQMPAPPPMPTASPTP